MDTIRNLLGLWRLTPDASVLKDIPRPGKCNEKCSHPAFTTFEDVFDFSIDSFGTDCKVIPEESDGQFEALFSAALDIRSVEKIFKKDLFRGSTFRLNTYSDLPVLNLEGQNFREHGQAIFREYLRCNLDKAFEDFKAACGADPELPYDKSADMVYIRMLAGFGWAAPRLMVGELYEVIETRNALTPIFKIPSWALKRTREGEVSNPPALLAKFPVDEYTDVQPEDDTVFLETFKVLVNEMPLKDAAEAARALR